MSDDGVRRVTAVLTDQLPKINKLCEDAAAMGQTTLLRTAKVVSDIMSDFQALGKATDDLERLRGLRNAQEPDEKLPSLGPTEVNPNGPPIEPLKVVK